VTCGDDLNRRDPDLVNVRPVEPNKAYNMRDVHRQGLRQRRLQWKCMSTGPTTLSWVRPAQRPERGDRGPAAGVSGRSIDINASDKGPGSSGSVIASTSRSSHS